MPVTTRNYSITQATPANLINALETAFSDLTWHDAVANNYILTFTNTAGSIIPAEGNKRYLLNPTSTSGTGTNAVFDIFRGPYGAVSVVTVVSGGANYAIIGQANSTSSGTTVYVPDTTGISAGMVVTKISGTGTLQSNTVVVSVTNSTTLVIDQAPSVALSAGAALQFADTLTFGAAAIGGSTYTVAATGTNAASVIYVSSNTNVLVGQLVTGTGIGSYVTVSSIAGNAITLSKANVTTVSGNVVFSDAVVATVATVANRTGITGTTSGVTITNVATNNNVYVGAIINITANSETAGMDTTGGPVFISTITGTGPYVLTLRNRANTFKGFATNSVNITFTASAGDANTWFASDRHTAPLTAAWGVLKNSVASGSKLGTTFWTFYSTTTAAAHQPIGGVQTSLLIRSSAGFNPSANQVQGVAAYDWFSSQAAVQANAFNVAIVLASTTLVPLTLRVHQSEVDPNFAVFSILENNTVRSNFFLSKYNGTVQPWSLNDVFLGSAFEVFPSPVYNVNEAAINIRTRMSGLPKRQAESGFGNYYQAGTGATYTNTFFHTSSGNRLLATPNLNYGDINFYVRAAGDIQSGVTNLAIFKNIPICPSFAPVPYYLPSDFVLAEIPSGNAIIGDTLTVSGGEIYTIIQFVTNQVSFVTLALAVRTT